MIIGGFIVRATGAWPLPWPRERDLFAFRGPLRVLREHGLLYEISHRGLLKPTWALGTHFIFAPTWENPGSATAVNQGAPLGLRAKGLDSEKICYNPY